MKKFIVTAIAAGALAAGTAASAQDLGSVIANALGFGGYNQGIPAVVAGSGQQQLYADSYGRQFYYDQYGRQVYINSLNSSTPQIVGYDSWGRPVYGATYSNPGTYAYGGTYGTYNNRRWDRDGDGVPNNQDRWPDDPRYR